MVVPVRDPRRSHRSDDRHAPSGGWRPRASGRLSASSLPVIATPVPGAWITSRTNDALVRARNAASASRPSRPAADLPSDLTSPPSGAGPPPWSTRSGHGPSPLGETLATRIAAILGVRPARAIRSYACVLSRLVVHAYGGPAYGETALAAGRGEAAIWSPLPPGRWCGIIDLPRQQLRPTTVRHEDW